MKRIVSISIVMLASTAALFNACSPQKGKMQKANNSAAYSVLIFMNEQKAIIAAKVDSTETYRKFRKDAIAKLSHNITAISNYKTAIDTSKTIEDKATAEHTADSLEAKNNELIVKLDNSKADKNWKKNKRNLKSDLDMLSFAIRCLKKEDKK